MSKNVMQVFITVLTFIVFALSGLATQTDKEVTALALLAAANTAEIARLSTQIEVDAGYDLILKALISKSEQYGHRDNYTNDQLAELSMLVLEKSRLYNREGLTPSIILSLFETESAFNPNAVSTASALGLGQVMQGTARPYLKDMGLPTNKELLFDPIINAEVAITHWMELHRLFVKEGLEDLDDFEITSLAYNNGLQATRMWLSGSQRYFNVKYFQKIRNNAAQFAEEGLD